MNLKEVRQEISNAETTIRQADWIVEDMVDVIVGRLQSASKPADDQWHYHTNLARLKQELKSFNMKTMKWRE